MDPSPASFAEVRAETPWTKLDAGFRGRASIGQENLYRSNSQGKDLDSKAPTVVPSSCTPTRAEDQGWSGAQEQPNTMLRYS